MKIRTIMAAAATGVLLTIAGSSLAFGEEWVCPRGYEDCQGYEYCTTHDHGDCDGYWSEDGNWVCPDGTHGSCASGTGESSSSARSHGHHRGGCGSHHSR